MNTISAPEGDSVISQILAAYELPGTILDIARHGKGHINDTFCVSCRTPEGGTVQLILQGLSQAAFPHPEEVMENFVGITSYLRREILAEGGDPSRETLSLVKTRDGADFVTDNRGRVWRLMPFIENADCYQSAGRSGGFSTCSGIIPPRHFTRPFPISTTLKSASVSFSPRWKPIS